MNQLYQNLCKNKNIHHGQISIWENFEKPKLRTQSGDFPFGKTLPIDEQIDIEKNANYKKKTFDIL